MLAPDEARICWVGELRYGPKRVNHGETPIRELQELGLNPQLAAEWTTNPGIYAGNIRAASLRFVNDVVMNPRGTVKPMWMSNEKLRLLSMLKGYWITAGNTILKRMAWRLTRGTLTDKARVLGAVGLMLPTAYLSDEIREFIKYGSEGDPKRKTETTAEMYLRIMNRAGLTGIFQMVDDALNAPRFGQSSLWQALGPQASQIEGLVRGAGEAREGRPERLEREVSSAIPILNITPATRKATRDVIFGSD